MKRAGEFLGLKVWTSEEVEPDVVYLLWPPQKPLLKVEVREQGSNG